MDGNHENFDYLYAFPEEDWNGGRIHRISENIVHLQRGNIYHIDGKSFFVMGGSKSSAKWKEAGLWYPQEDPTKEEIALAYENLKKHNNTVDYVLTHKYWKDGSKSDDRYSLLGLQGFIDENVTFQRWYAGHWHCNHVFDEKHLFVYDEPTPLK